MPLRFLFRAAHVITATAVLGLLPAKAAQPNAPRLAPPFRLEQTGNNWWLLTPQDRRLFSLGLCVVTRGAARAEFNSGNPGYAAWQHYPNDQAWVEATLGRLRRWGFTTIGGWSDHLPLLQSSNMLNALTPVLHVGSTAGAPWWDMWDEKIIARMDSVAKEQILAVRDNPRLLGYYTDNEMGWWNAILFHMALDQVPSSGQRQRLLQLLRDGYANDWNKLRADFEPESADSFDALAQRGQLWLRPGGQGILMMRRFLSLVAARYYQLVREIIRKYDRRALILGDRYQSFFYPEVARAAAPYIDAISSNLNASWCDGSFVRFQLDTLHGLTGRPVFVSEIYMTATENRSGNKNDRGVFPVVPTQAERARALRVTLDALTRLPYVVGIDWFQFFDEPRAGRGDGENFNFGLVDIHDQPYAEVTSVFARARLADDKARNKKPRVDASAGIPPAPADPFAALLPTRALQDWDRERGFVKAASPFPLAELYVGWSPSHLYLGLYAHDVVEEAYYRDKSVPMSERPVWTVQVDQSDDLRASIGPNPEGVAHHPEVRLETLAGVNLNVRHIAILGIPARTLGRQKLRAGDKIDLRSVLVTHARANRVEWRGTFKLSR